MLRPVTLGLALSVLAAACAVAEQPEPSGTIEQHVLVRNERGPVELTVNTENGVLAESVWPRSLPARSRTDVTFRLPPGIWWIEVNGGLALGKQDLMGAMRKGCPLEFGLEANTQYSLGCQ